jgi:hypothetical protein
MGKPRISPDEWGKFALDQLLSEKWNNIQKELYSQMKQCMPEVEITEQYFFNGMLGSQLELLCLVSVHANFKLGVSVTVLVHEYIKKLPPEIQSKVEDSYKYCNNKVAEYGKKGLSGYDAIANACAERLNLKPYSDFASMLAAEFEALGNTWKADIGQYQFD